MTVNLPIDDAAVTEIAEMDDPILRNLWITTAYHDFATRLDTRIPTDVTWCAFAIWASRTAGASIRGDAFPDPLRDALAADPGYHGYLKRVQDRHRWMQRLHLVEPLEHLHVLKAMEDVTADISAAIAEGNALVFAELGPIFVAFLEALEGPEPAGPEELKRVVAEALDSMPAGSDRVGLETAFGCYADATAAEAEHRAQLVLAANIGAVAHEQTRLQPAVATALDTAIDVGLPQIILDNTPGFLRPLAGWLTARPLKRVQEAVLRSWEEVATAAMMRLQTSDETLHLGEEIPPLPDGTVFPPALVEVEGERATAAWSAWHRGQTSAAKDWADLHERMNYIVHLFRSRQQHQPLLTAPYSPDQLDAMREGRIPDPPL